jgi:SAM-dependent methyltransferase
VPEPVSRTAPASSDREPWSPTSGPPTPACAWCGSSLRDADRHDIGRIWCECCGVATTSPWPSDAQLEAAYGEWYRPDGGRFGSLGDALLRHTRSTLARRIDRLAPPGRVLDVGAGDGTLVAALVRRGRDAVGLERHADGPHLQDGELVDVTGTWAAIVFWHSLEHLREPGAALDHAARLLEPGGLLIVALPNVASRQAKRFGDRWLALDLPRHLVHVPADAVLSKLGDVGLRVGRVSFLRGGQVAFGWAHGFVAELPGHADLYDAIRSSGARAEPMTLPTRVLTLLAGALAAPFAVIATVVEVLGRRGGTIYVEAHR